jgi:hypothetical protein
MRRFVVVAALAIGLVTSWAAILPLVAQPVLGTASPAMSGALFLCRSQRGIDRTCAEALARALIIDPAKRDATSATDKVCHPDLPELRRTGAGG